jgi:glycosyltransferase involved in cell wall biosynthesis
MPIRIGVNALYLIPGGVGGTEIYLRNLLAALAAIDPANTYLVFTNRETADLAPPAGNFQALQQRVAAASRPVRILWEQTLLPRAVGRARCDVVLNAGFTGPVLCGCPQVTVFHDLQHRRHPEYFRWFDLPFWRLLLWASVRRSKELIAVSEASAADLRRYYGADATVVPHGVETRFFEIAGERRPEPYLLCVSTLHPHKGIDTLLAAFARFRETQPRFSLVVSGMKGFYTRELEALAASLSLGDAVRFTGWIPREQLYELYRKAWGFVYPSKFEGFGMPVAEAMAGGIPVACSDIAPLREVAGGAVLFFPPADVEGLAEALARISGDDDLRRRLSLEGPRQAARFTWQAAARATLNVLERAAGVQDRERLNT